MEATLPQQGSTRRARSKRPSWLARRKERRGQALVEFAFGLPFLLLILLGTIDMGQMFFEYIQLRGAVREAAAYGARNPTDTVGMESAVLSHAPDLASGTTVSVNVIGDVEVYGDAIVQVQAARVFQPVTTGFLQRFGLGPFTMTSTATARVWT